MNYIVVDFEFNQAFDFKTNSKGISNPTCPFEIIQIGAVKLNHNFETIEEFNRPIKPTIYKSLHPYVKKLISLDSSDFKTADNFDIVFKDFLEFCGSDEYTFIFWGDTDIKALFNNIIYYNLDTNLVSHKFIDIQIIISKMLKNSPGKLIGLKNAIESFDIEINDAFHDAFNDAQYTTKLLKIIKGKITKATTYKLPSNKVKSPSKKTINTVALYSSVEKELGRKLTLKEKDVFKHVYIQGKNNAFNKK